MSVAVSPFARPRALGARLRRLSERIDQDCARLYADLGIRFEQRWFGVMNQLAAGEALSVGQLAERLGISHASVSQTCGSLRAAGLIDAAPDPEDARSRRLSLSGEGRALFEGRSTLWDALEAVSAALDEEAGGVIDALDALDAALDRRSLRRRVQDRLDGGDDPQACPPE